MEKPEMMRKNITRGSLILVLLVSVMALVIIEALIVISSLNINMIRSQIEYSQNCLMAQSATSQFLYEVDNFQSSNAVDISSTVKNMDFKTRFSCYPVFVEKKPYMKNEVKITFDKTKDYYSTDNFNSEAPAQGWKDRNNTSTSVPPYTVDLTITARAGGSRHCFEVLINRIWSYAVFCQKDSIVITTLINLKYGDLYTQPSKIKGDILSCFRIFLGLPKIQDIGNEINGNICTTSTYAPDQDPLFVKSGNKLNGIKKYYSNKNDNNGCYSFFSNLKYPCKDEYKEIKKEYYSQLIEIGNSLSYSLAFQQNQSITGEESNSFSWTDSSEEIEKFENMVSTLVSTALSKPEDLSDDTKLYIESFYQCHNNINILKENEIQNAIRHYVLDTYFGKSYFLKENLILQGDSKCNRFYLKGNLSNHYSKYKKNSFLTQNEESNNSTSDENGKNVWEIDEDIYSKAGIILENCTLFVDGDVELLENNTKEYSAEQTENLESEIPVSINGKNSTLIVSGNLKIIGGTLDSKDKGMVMLAKNIEFSTKGNYNGLILSKGKILINPYPFKTLSSPQDRLNINGAIACSGEYIKDSIEGGNTSASDYPYGLVLSGVNLNYDPRYTKTLHQFGKPFIALWQQIQ